MLTVMKNNTINKNKKVKAILKKSHYTKLKHPNFHWKPHSALRQEASFRIFVHYDRRKRKDGSLIQQHSQLHGGFQIPSDPFSQDSSAQPLE